MLADGQTKTIVGKQIEEIARSVAELFAQGSPCDALKPVPCRARESRSYSVV
mgnify:FL=1